VSEGDRRVPALLVRAGRHFERLGKDSTRSLLHLFHKERTVNPIVLLLVVILIVSLLGGGYGFRSGNAVLGTGGGLIGLILLILLILALLGRLPL
jgi:hypothetical protein